MFAAYVRDLAFPSLYDTTTVIVRVSDQNDNAPVFKDPVYRLEVPENTNVAVVHTVVAMDPDSGINGQIIYSIAGLSSPIFSFRLVPLSFDFVKFQCCSSLD